MIHILERQEVGMGVFCKTGYWLLTTWDDETNKINHIKTEEFNK